jgi:hypothetical protein
MDAKKSNDTCAKKSNDVSNINRKSAKKLENAKPSTLAQESGIGNTPKAEPELKFIKSGNETIIKGNFSDSYIVLGKDKPSGKYSGYGGTGDTKSAAIDIVAGRLSPITEEETEEGEDIYTDNNFTLDAARIYISQRTDVDTNFNLVDGSIGNSKAKSAIALKADGIRIIAREGIKLVTKTDFANSTGLEIYENNGIELIALNDETNLQPMLLGENTVECIAELITEIDKLQNRIEYFIEEQHKYNDIISKHTHNSPFFGILTLPSPELIIDNMSLTLNKLLNVTVPYYFQKVNFGSIKTKYLGNGEKAIKSKYNKVN